MKAIFITLILALANIISSAQSAITLTNLDLPVVGKTLYVYHDTSSFYTESINTEAGKNGSSQTWNFSELNTNTIDTIEYVEPASTGYNDTFPNAQVCALSSMYDNAIFINTANDGFYIDGMLSYPSNSVLKYSTASVLINYPSTYLDTAYNVSEIVSQSVFGKPVKMNGIQYFADSVKRTVTQKVHSIIDAYGIVSTPGGSFDALRQNVIQTTERSMYYYLQGPGWTLFKTKAVESNLLRWWANGYGCPVAECRYYPNSGVVRSFSFVKQEDPIVVTGIKEANNNFNINVYPNPAVNNIVFSNVSENSTVSVYSATGSLMLEKYASVNESICTQNWSRGLYLYSIVNSKGALIQSGKFNLIY